MSKELEISPQELKAKPREERMKIMKKMRDKDREPVKGIFRFYEIPGGSMSFNFRMYKDDPIERFDMMDGGIYTIPLGVAKHLNRNGWYPIHVFKQDEEGKPYTQQVGKKVRRFGFQSLEFIDVADLTEIGTPVIR